MLRHAAFARLDFSLKVSMCTIPWQVSYSPVRIKDIKGENDVVMSPPFMIPWL